MDGTNTPTLEEYIVLEGKTFQLYDEKGQFKTLTEGQGFKAMPSGMIPAITSRTIIDKKTYDERLKAQRAAEAEIEQTAKAKNSKKGAK